MNTRKATISEVAQRAGVSKATVSRVLNGTAQVSEQTQGLVRQAIEDTGFTINAQAKALSLGRTNTFAVVLTEPLDDYFGDPTYSTVFRGIAAELAETEISPVLIQADSPLEREKVHRLLGSRTFDAVIHLSPFDDIEGLERMRTLRVPVVLCGQVTGDQFADVYSCVYADDVLGAQLAAHYAQSLGRKRPALIMGKEDAPATADRLRGYREVLGASFDSYPRMFGSWGQENGYTATYRLLADNPQTDLLICGSDRIAAGALDALEMMGRSVPDDVAVIGFDDHKIASQVIPALTTVAQPMLQQGKLAAQIAQEMLQDSVARTVVLDMELKVRQSA